MHLRIIDEQRMDHATDHAIKAALVVCFPDAVANFSQTRVWHGSAPAYTVLMESDGTVIAHLGVVQREIRVGDQPVSMAGVQNVCVRPEHRGRGLVDQILNESMLEAHRRHIDLGLLFCVPKLEKVYARCGWRPATPRVIQATRTSGERYQLDDHNILMFHPLRIDQLPPGDIDLIADDW